MERGEHATLPEASAIRRGLFVGTIHRVRLERPAPREGKGAGESIAPGSAPPAFIAGEAKGSEVADDLDVSRGLCPGGNYNDEAEEQDTTTRIS
jgi:hypothetical protein